MMFRASDMGHCAKSFDLHQYWVVQQKREFLDQGDEEKKLGIPVSPLCDRENIDVAPCQCGFLEIIAIPVFDELLFLDSSGEINAQCMTNCIQNLQIWQNSPPKITEIATYQLKPPPKTVFELLRPMLDIRQDDKKPLLQAYDEKLKGKVEEKIKISNFEFFNFEQIFQNFAPYGRKIFKSLPEIQFFSS